jgi:uncharacterized protein YegP (UPF0339 family)
MKHFLTYRTPFRRQCRWRLVAANGRILCSSGEGFHNRADMLANIAEVKNSANVEVR